MAADGDFVVVWTGCCQDGSFAGIFGQRYDSGGAARGNEFRVNSYTTREQRNPLVASDESGNFVVVWTSDRQDGDGYGIFGQRYDSGGVALGSEFRVNSHTNNWQYSPSVTRAAEGDFVVVWASGGQDGSGYGIFGQRYDSGGAAQGSEFRVNSYTIGSQQFHSVASDASGNFVVVWSSSGQDGSSWGIFGQRYDSGGAPLGTEFRVNTYTTGSQAVASVASDASGNFVVAWTSDGEDGSDSGVVGRRYDSGGVPQGGGFRINSYTTGAQRIPSVGSTGITQFVVVWASNDQDGDGYGVFGQRIDFGGDTIPPSVTVIAPNGGERLFTGSTYLIQWTASDHIGLSSFDAFVSVDGGGSFTPIAECQNLPQSATSCVWLAPGPPSASALVRVTAEDTSGNSASDDSDAVFSIISGTASVTVESPNSDVKWQIGSLQSIEWMHNLGLKSTFRIELDRDDDGSYEELIAAAAPADGARSGSFAWSVTAPASATCRVRISWTGNLAVTDSSDVTFQITLDPLEFQINTYTPSSQSSASVAADASGNFVVVWESNPQDGDGSGIFGQRYDNGGMPLGDEFQINSFTTDSQQYPSVASDASGNFVVVWDSGGDSYYGGTASDIFGQRYDSAGGALGTEFRVNSYTPGRQYRSAVASDANGNFVVVWSRYFTYDGGQGIFGQRYDSAGAKLGSEFRVSSYPPSNQQFPSIASDATGNFVVVWESYAQDGDHDGVFSQRYDSEGVAQGDEFQINSHTTNRQQISSVGATGTNRFVVAWTSHEQDGDDGGVFGRRLDFTGLSSLSISDVSVNEGNVPGRASRVWALFAVTLSAPSAQQVTLDYATANGTAMAPSDYNAKSGTLTLSPGQTSAVIAVRVKEDNLDESDETFFVNLSNPMNASIADGQGLGKIVNDDP